MKLSFGHQMNLCLCFFTFRMYGGPIRNTQANTNTTMYNCTYKYKFNKNTIGYEAVSKPSNEFVLTQGDLGPLPGKPPPEWFLPLLMPPTVSYALHCAAMHCIAQICTPLHSIALHFLALLFLALPPSAMRCNALSSIVLQCSAPLCSIKWSGGAPQNRCQESDN